VVACLPLHDDRGGGEKRRAPPLLWARKSGAHTAERRQQLRRESRVRACMHAFVPQHEPRAACVVDTQVEGTDTRVRRVSREERCARGERRARGEGCARSVFVPDGDDDGMSTSMSVACSRAHASTKGRPAVRGVAHEGRGGPAGGRRGRAGAQVGGQAASRRREI
jgi:hypothetical protein